MNTTKFFLQDKNGQYYTLHNWDNGEVKLSDKPSPVSGVLELSLGLKDHTKPIIFTGQARRILDHISNSTGIISICKLSFGETTLSLNFATYHNDMAADVLTLCPMN